MSQAVEHAAHLPLSALAYRYAVVIWRGLYFLNYGRMCGAILKLDALLELAFFLWSQPSSYRDEIFLLLLESGMCEAVGEFAVVGQQQKPRGVLVQSPHGVQSEMPVLLRQGINDCRASSLVAGSGHNPFWLVQDEVKQLPGLEVNRLAVYGNVVTFYVHGLAEVLGYLTVDFHAALLYGIGQAAPGA
jgi:hypothetical protein